MIRWLVLGLVGLVLLLVAGCAKSPFGAHPPAVEPDLSTPQLLEQCWLAPGHRYLSRHSGVLDLFWKKVPLDGVIRIDTDQQLARLVAMDAMGVKLFDLSVTATDYTLNYLLPLLEEHPRLPQVVADSVRQVFIAPNPQRHDRQIPRPPGDDGPYILHSAEQPQTRFVFGGQPVRLLTKRSQQGWQVDYYDYVRQGTLWAPTGIILQGDSGYRLTLWIQEIKQL